MQDVITMKVSLQQNDGPKHVETEVNNKHLIVAFVVFSPLFIL